MGSKRALVVVRYLLRAALYLPDILRIFLSFPRPALLSLHNNRGSRNDSPSTVVSLNLLLFEKVLSHFSPSLFPCIPIWIASAVTLPLCVHGQASQIIPVSVRSSIHLQLLSFFPRILLFHFLVFGIYILESRRCDIYIGIVHAPAFSIHSYLYPS